MPPLATAVAYAAPVPQGALVRAPNANVVYHRGAKALKAYRSAIEDACREQVTLVNGLPFEKGRPVTVEIDFYVKPLKKPVREFPSVSPDIDKLTRSVLDAISGRRKKATKTKPAEWIPGVWLYDDAQVCRIVVTKVYARTEEEVRTVVALWDGVVGVPIDETGTGNLTV
jgi:Holliday junction resolvase RusA-like endonuclease